MMPNAFFRSLFEVTRMGHKDAESRRAHLLPKMVDHFFWCLKPEIIESRIWIADYAFV